MKLRLVAALAVLVGCSAYAQDGQSKRQTKQTWRTSPRPDLRTGMSKRAVEAPVKKALQPTRQELAKLLQKLERAAKKKPAPVPRFSLKSKVERPVKRALKPKWKVRWAPTALKPGQVAPGKVRWHASFEAAVRAAKTSGKPVLLFHTLGDLTDPFC